MNEDLNVEDAEEDFTGGAVFHVGAGDVGTRVDAFLSAKLHVSRARAQKLLESATLNGQLVKAKTTLRAGDAVEVPAWDDEDAAPINATPEELARAPHVPVLYEDDALLVVVKPRGVTVHVGAGDTGATLVDILRAQGKTLSNVGPPGRAGIVHRLDKDTSGVMLVAKTDAAHWNLTAQFQARTVEKRYVALLNGVPPARGRIEAAIERSHTNRKKMTVAPGGRPAITEYEVQRSWPKFALVDINLLTGRTHQIRAHFTYLQHPIVGDGIYGGLYRALTCAPNERSKTLIEALNGQALHARVVGCAHPATGEPLRFEAPPPAVFADLISALGEG